jgi:type IV pilus assembly protein PilY1
MWCPILCGLDHEHHSKFTVPVTATHHSIRPQPITEASMTQRPPKTLNFRPIALAALLLLQGIASPGMAAQLSLANAPAGSGGREPAPNIILSVDDSGSMATSDSPTMAGLKAALNNAFSTTAVADNSIRLGFQSMWRCRGFGAGQTNSYGGSCPENRVRPFSGTHRTGFNAWVNSLTPYSNTPSHLMIKNAGEFMKTTGVWNPYAKDPGTTESPLLSCRKSFQIFMTDGEWNSEFSYGNDPTTAGNADGTNRTLPDGTAYVTDDTYVANVHTPQTFVYRDPYGHTITGYTQPIIGYQQKITGYVQIITGYQKNGTPIYGNDPTQPIYGNDTSKPIYGPSIPVYGASTVSDYVFDYWATDLQPDIPNEVRPMIKVPGATNFGTTASPYLLQEYWNPHNNPATWQSLTTYTIGFGPGAALSTSGANNHPWWGGTTGTTWSGGDYSNLVTGAVNWEDPTCDTSGTADCTGEARRKELWHMAINGRGRYVSAKNSAELATAFSEIVNQILIDTSSPLVSIAANTQSIRTDTRAYVAGYDANKWSGSIKSYALTSTDTVNQTSLWDAAALLDSANISNRLIFTHNGTDPTTFVWANLSNLQKTYLQDGGTTTLGQDRLNYVRGDRTKEVQSGGTLRNRDHRLGDIVNSALWTVGKPELGYTLNNYRAFRTAQNSRTSMVYVGANDGMMHGFSTVDGNEKMAYIPQGVYGNLASLTYPAYTHRYFVDGQPFTGDFYDGTAWHTALVGTLAGGGKGFFVLDVTTPDNWSSASAASLVILDKTDLTNFTASSAVGLPAALASDIGYLYGQPTMDDANQAHVVQMTKLNNGRWAVLLGNGVNSTSENAVLLIQYLDGAKELVKLVADGTVGAGNGLANPQVIDFNGDGKADVAYAGDLKGNLWKFDLSSTNPSLWSVAYSGSPLFVARDTAGTRQPISTAPTWVVHPDGGIMLAFGTGREVTEADRLDVSLQTLYAVWDNTTVVPGATSTTLTGGSVIADSGASYGRTNLVQQTQTLTTTINGQTFYKTSTNAVTYTGAGAKRGWYMDWPTLGERTVANGGILDKRLMFMRSRKPAVGSLTDSAEETCTPNSQAAEEYLTIVDILSGKPSPTPAFDTDGGGFTGTELTGVSRWKSGTDDRLWLRKGRPDGKNNEVVSISPRANDTMRIQTGSINPARIGWRQLQ